MLSGMNVYVCAHAYCQSGVKMLSGRLISSNCVYGPLRQGGGCQTRVQKRGQKRGVCIYMNVHNVRVAPTEK